MLDSSICWVEGGLPQFGKREFGVYGGESVAARRYPYHEHAGFLEVAGLDCSYVLYAGCEGRCYHFALGGKPTRK